MKCFISMIAIGLFLACPVLADTSGDARGRRGDGERLKRHVAQSFEEKNSAEDLLRVHVTYARPNDDGTYSAVVVAHWGDLDNLIRGGGADYYSNWNGSMVLKKGTVEKVHKFFFDDQWGEPKPGTGADKITKQTDHLVRWKSAVVGATDGLIFRLKFTTLNTVATLHCGDYSFDIKPIVRQGNTTN